MKELKIDELLKQILASKINDNTRFLVSKMIDDEDFMLDFLALVTSICYHKPSFLLEITRQIMILDIETEDRTNDK